MNTLILLVLIFLCVISWQSAQKARETVMPFCRRCCERMQFQLLDDTVALHRIRPMRNKNGWLGWHRVYSFEFCDPDMERRKGLIVYAENQVQSIQIQDEDGRIFLHPDKT